MNQMALQTRILVDGNEVYDSCPRAVTAKLLTFPANLQFWSLDGLKQFLVGTCEVVHAWCRARLDENPPEDLKAKYKRYGTWAARTIKNFPGKQEHAVTYVYNVAMAGEGCGLLNGFGMTNSHGDKLSGNPEKTCLRKPEGDFF
jgi:hypothetical protein